MKIATRITLPVFGFLVATTIGFIPMRPVMAHHSLAAEFDVSKTVTITGTITRMEWKNPHSWLHVDVKDPRGRVASWAIEFGAPNALYRRGWRKTDMPEKTVVTIKGYPALDKSTTISAIDVKFADGRTLFAGTAQPAK